MKNFYLNVIDNGKINIDNAKKCKVKRIKNKIELLLIKFPELKLKGYFIMTNKEFAERNNEKAPANDKKKTIFLLSMPLKKKNVYYNPKILPVG